MSSSSLSSLVDNLTEGLHNNKCIHCKSNLEFISTKDELLMFNFRKCRKNHNKEFSEDLIKKSGRAYSTVMETLISFVCC